MRVLLLPQCPFLSEISAHIRIVLLPAVECKCSQKVLPAIFLCKNIVLVIVRECVQLSVQYKLWVISQINCEFLETDQTENCNFINNFNYLRRPSSALWIPPTPVFLDYYPRPCLCVIEGSDPATGECNPDKVFPRSPYIKLP